MLQTALPIDVLRGLTQRGGTRRPKRRTGQTGAQILMGIATAGCLHRHDSGGLLEITYGKEEEFGVGGRMESPRFVCPQVSLQEAQTREDETRIGEVETLANHVDLPSLHCFKS